MCAHNMTSMCSMFSNKIPHDSLNFARAFVCLCACKFSDAVKMTFWHLHTHIHIFNGIASAVSESFYTECNRFTFLFDIMLTIMPMLFEKETKKSRLRYTLHSKLLHITTQHKHHENQMDDLKSNGREREIDREGENERERGKER